MEMIEAKATLDGRYLAVKAPAPVRAFYDAAPARVDTQDGRQWKKFGYHNRGVLFYERA